MEIFIVYNHQIEHLNKLAQKAFIQRSLNFLKDVYPRWTNARKQEEIVIFIHQIIVFGEQYRFKQESIYQELIRLAISYDMLEYFPLPEVYEKILRNAQKEEYSKIELLKDYIIYQFNHTNE